MTLHNDDITIEVSAHGAELTSLRRQGVEHLWTADPAFWNRHAPILFPAVGKPYGNTLRIDGKAYTMKQHGFARDCDFLLQPDGTLRLDWDEALLPTDKQGLYPYRCTLEARYSLEGTTLTAEWTVTNRDSRNIFFQIGAHPGFMLPDYDAHDAVHGYVHYLDRQGNPVSPVVTSALQDGNRVPLAAPLTLPAEMPLTDDTFAHDALMLEEGQVAEALLCDKQGRPVLSVSCPQAEAFGIWAPHKQGCPFVCLEPWCGICDQHGYTGDISHRPYIHALAPNETYLFTYKINLK